ncbi:MAG TPA: flavin reductase family protein [Dehalococcoidia bacterium]|nr:flavin reductase family protein [Dehalococcoidia bacterium]
MNNKKRFGPQPWIFPNPTVLVGTVVNGKPNFAPYAWCGITGGEPPTLAVGVRHERYTLKGIKQNLVFSVNVPSVDLLAETDYCGITSGAKVDKAKDCGFSVFYGTLDKVPLIKQCPVNLECEVLHMLNVGIHTLVIGKIVETHVSENCLTDGQPDIMKIKPFVYSRGPTARYNAVGDVLGQAFSAGKSLKKN